MATEKCFFCDSEDHVARFCPQATGLRDLENETADEQGLADIGHSGVAEVVHIPLDDDILRSNTQVEVQNTAGAQVEVQNTAGAQVEVQNTAGAQLEVQNTAVQEIAFSRNRLLSRYASGRALTTLSRTSQATESSSNTAIRTILFSGLYRGIQMSDLTAALLHPEMPVPVFVKIHHRPGAKSAAVAPRQLTASLPRDWFAFVTYGTVQMAGTARYFFNRQAIVWGSHTSWARRNDQRAPTAWSLEQSDAYYAAHPQCRQFFPRCPGT
uniref:CCHC-type domain-containing protein n=1 Tax=Ditylenchus dipsaci TaxID=166011 RepID=A0A915ET69_9BILA